MSVAPMRTTAETSRERSRRSPVSRRLPLPEPRGPWSGRLFASLLREPGAGLTHEDLEAPPDALADDDFQLALYIAYELNYSCLEGVDEAWEAAVPLLAFRARLEHELDVALQPLGDGEEADPSEVGERLQRIVAEDDSPPLSRYLETQATRTQMLEHVTHRSAYQLKEADPHSWAIPGLAGRAKAALLEIQFDEYGGGRPERMHSALFAKTMRGLGLDPSYGAYVALLPGITLATVNLLSRFGMHRSRRGALVGQLAVFEMTSSVPNRRYGNALRRLGYGADVTDFYDEHVEADAVHESIAAWDLAGGLALEEPATAQDILFGARASLAVEGRWAAHLLEHWRAGESSLLEGSPVPQAQPTVLSGHG